ncbi:MAG TPA: VWA domain-containing protein [Candidatus Aquilonibacter sp.]|nr:VWA domain-containing protein [Candidatus Aquilonibacter sp.]
MASRSKFLPQPALIIFSTLFSALLAGSARAQSALDVANITPRVESALVATSLNPAIRKSVDMVLVPVSVTDEMERLVVGLGPGNFVVLDDKHRQQIKHFSTDDAPVSVGVIVDMSGSMRDKLDRVQEAVRQFCRASNLQDEFFLITFSDQPHLLTDFTNSDNIEQELLFAHPSGRTALLDAIYMGLGRMREAKYARKVLLIISDGGDNHSRYSEKELKATVKESDVMIYAIGTFDRFVPTEEERLGPWLLSDITGVTGGRAFVLDDAREMPALAHRVGTELRLQYVLGYDPPELPHNGKWHRISVKLILPKHLPFLRVHARTGYYAANSGPPVATLSR